jgi:ribonuclease HI
MTLAREEDHTHAILSRRMAAVEGLNTNLLHMVRALQRDVRFLKTLLIEQDEKFIYDQIVFGQPDRAGLIESIRTDCSEQVNVILNNTDEISIYCDCSLDRGKHIIGLSACFVGSGKINVEQLQMQTEIEVSLYAELQAIKFALEMLPQIIEHFHDSRIRKLCIYSDVDLIEKYMQGQHLKKPYMKDAVRDIRDLVKGLPYQTSLRYIGEEAVHRVFHKITHRASRKVIGKN